jgi:hypothetical protein
MDSIYEKPTNRPIKKIVRKCPVLVDVIFVLMQLGMALTLGFFSYYYKAIDRPCSATYGDTSPMINPKSAGSVGTDVQSKFTMAIRFGFYLAILNFSRVVINQIGIWIKSSVLYYIAIVLYGINFMLALVWFVFMQIWRWCYTGRVCSGDFLTKA